MPAVFTANLLQNAAFESSSTGWRANNLAGAVNLQQYKSTRHNAGYVVEGSGFLEMNTSQTGGSVAQDVAVAPEAGQSYSFSVWLRAAPGAPEISGAVALWGLGGAQESGSTSFSVGQEWTQVTAPLDVQMPGHTGLRAEIYMNTTGANLDATGALLIARGLQNASFESSSAGWRANNLAGSVSVKQLASSHYSAGYTREGSGFLEASTSEAAGSVAQDVPIPAQPGESYSFSAWLRAAPGAGNISGTLALWALGGAQESGGTQFTVGQQWTRVWAPLDVQNSGHTGMRAEIYLQTTGASLDIDGAALTSAGLKNASFESSAAGWRANNLASGVNLQQFPSTHYSAGYAHAGSGFLEINTSQAGGSVAQDVAVPPQAGESYSFSVWLRAAPGAASVSGTVALWALGGTQESSSANFIVGQNWTLITAPLDVQNAGHTGLRVEIYVNTTGVGLDANGAVLTLAPFHQQVSLVAIDSQLQNGDILIFVPTDATGALINTLSGGEGYSHAGLVSGNQMIDVDNTDNSLDPQVELVALPAALTRKHLGVRIGLSELQAFQLCNWCRGKLGSGMDWSGILTKGLINEPGTYFCSMLIMAGLDAIGFNRSAIGLGGFVSPNDIARVFHAPPGSSL